MSCFPFLLLLLRVISAYNLSEADFSKCSTKLESPYNISNPIIHVNVEESSINPPSTYADIGTIIKFRIYKLNTTILYYPYDNDYNKTKAITNSSQDHMFEFCVKENKLQMFSFCCNSNLTSQYGAFTLNPVEVVSSTVPPATPTWISNFTLSSFMASLSAEGRIGPQPTNITGLTPQLVGCATSFRAQTNLAILGYVLLVIPWF